MIQPGKIYIILHPTIPRFRIGSSSRALKRIYNEYNLPGAQIIWFDVPDHIGFMEFIARHSPIELPNTQYINTIEFLQKIYYEAYNKRAIVHQFGLEPWMTWTPTS
jgi:hypothetical protein